MYVIHIGPRIINMCARASVVQARWEYAFYSALSTGATNEVKTCNTAAAH